MLLAACAPDRMQPVTPTSLPDLPLIQGKGFVGVIFPEKMAEDAARALGFRPSGYWTPSAVEVQQLELGLRGFLERARDNPQVADQYAEPNSPRGAAVVYAIAEILTRFDRYRRQYIGIVDPFGAKRVLINCFPVPDSEPSRASDGWRHQVVVVDDGGSSYWRIQYDIASGAYVGFDSNG